MSTEMQEQHMHVQCSMCMNATSCADSSAHTHLLHFAHGQPLQRVLNHGNIHKGQQHFGMLQGDGAEALSEGVCKQDGLQHIPHPQLLLIPFLSPSWWHFSILICAWITVENVQKVTKLRHPALWSTVMI